MAFRHDSYDTGDHSQTYHDGGTLGSMTVTHNRHAGSYVVSFRGDRQHHGFVHFSGTPTAELYTRFGSRESREQSQPPSERLQQLIAQHHLHPDQWPILLDALQEEYPQLHEAIESHHAARRAAAESDATQYARAVSATLSATR